MIISKCAIIKENYITEEYFYQSAREGMFDILLNMSKYNLFETVFVPGYVGWSSQEGSGIFDPISKINNVNIIYYKMDKNLNIDCGDLFNKVKKFGKNKFVTLIVNYFGFIDPEIEYIYTKIRDYKGWIIEDNAHGFFTNLYSSHTCADATFYSLHKMFPFNKGGSIKIYNSQLRQLSFSGIRLNETVYNPWQYDVNKIAFLRISNYRKLDNLVKLIKYNSLFEPLKINLNKGLVPQTYPIIIKVGNRDKIYELMNQSGYGVVSLYHTLIEPLRNKDHTDALNLSKHILNLPVHQDVDSSAYNNMLELLAKFCLDTV